MKIYYKYWQQYIELKQSPEWGILNYNVTDGEWDIELKFSNDRVYEVFRNPFNMSFSMLAWDDLQNSFSRAVLIQENKPEFPFQMPRLNPREIVISFESENVFSMLFPPLLEDRKKDVDVYQIDLKKMASVERLWTFHSEDEILKSDISGRYVYDTKTSHHIVAISQYSENSEEMLSGRCLENLAYHPSGHIQTATLIKLINGTPVWEKSVVSYVICPAVFKGPLVKMGFFLYTVGCIAMAGLVIRLTKPIVKKTKKLELYRPILDMADSIRAKRKDSILLYTEALLSLSSITMSLVFVIQQWMHSPFQTAYNPIKEKYFPILISVVVVFKLVEGNAHLLCISMIDDDIKYAIEILAFRNQFPFQHGITYIVANIKALSMAFLIGSFLFETHVLNVNLFLSLVSLGALNAVVHFIYVLRKWLFIEKKLRINFLEITTSQYLVHLRRLDFICSNSVLLGMLILVIFTTIKKLEGPMGQM